MERDKGQVEKLILSWLKPLNYRQLSFFTAAYLLTLFFITIAHHVPNSGRYNIGEISKGTIRSEYTFLYTDKFELENLSQTIESNKPFYYRITNAYMDIFNKNLDNFGDTIKENDSDFLKSLQFKGFHFSSDTLNYLVKNRIFLKNYLKRLFYLYQYITGEYVIIEDIGNQKKSDFYYIVKKSGWEKINADKILFYPLDKDFVINIIGKIYTGMGSDAKVALAEILVNIAQPNAAQDQKIRSNIIQQELESLKDNKIIKAGEFLIKRGEIVNRDNLSKILAYTDYKQNNLKNKIWIYYALSLFLYLFLIYRFFKYESETFIKEYNVSVALLAFIFVNAVYYSTYIYNEIPFLPFFLTIPYAIVSITLPLLLKNTRVAIILLISYSFFFVLYPGFEIISFLNLIVISFATIYTSQILKNRNDFFIVALIIGVIELVFSFIYLKFNEINIVLGDWGVIVLFSFGNGFVSAIISSGIMPLLEYIFNIPTRFRLMELTNPTTSPLLKALKMEAPGTYNHSLLLGDMCEAAAEKLGIDSLLVKAGGYYHDIGKMEIPQYFIENQDGENKHDEIKVSMSVSVLKSHIKLGVELARKYRLPEEVIDYIKEHHGTTAISYFYHQALGLFGDENVNIEDYLYQGPKPRSKGTAVLMLADGIEASVRAYSQNNERFTTKIIEDIIDDIIKKRMEKDQFDDCNITLFDLKIVKEEFFKFLSGYYHKRIEYAKR